MVSGSVVLPFLMFFVFQFPFFSWVFDHKSIQSRNKGDLAILRRMHESCRCRIRIESKKSNEIDYRAWIVHGLYVDCARDVHKVH